MEIVWDFTAGAYFDQLSLEDRSKVVHSLKRLAADWNAFGALRLHRLSPDEPDLFSLRVGADLRVLLRRESDLITVVDVVRHSQVDGLRQLTKDRRVAAG